MNKFPLLCTFMYGAIPKISRSASVGEPGDNVKMCDDQSARQYFHEIHENVVVLNISEKHYLII